MRQSTSMIEIGAFVARHLERRVRPDIGELRQVAVARRVRALVRGCGASLVTGGTQPFYERGADRIVMPPLHFYLLRRLWWGRRMYAIVCLHELVHWSGHGARLGRAEHERAFDENYRREECVAEMGSALLCFDLGVSSRPTFPHARYLNAFLQSLPNPEVEMELALGRANQAAGYILASWRAGKEVGSIRAVGAFA